MGQESLHEGQTPQRLGSDAEGFVRGAGFFGGIVRVGVEGVQIHEGQRQSLVSENLSQGFVPLVGEFHAVTDNTKGGRK
jgi:hypothetical protein